MDVFPVAAAFGGALGGELSSVLPFHAPGGVGTYPAGIVAGAVSFGASASPDAMVRLAAAAVNAVHVKVGQGRKHAVLFTLQPREFLDKTSADVPSYFSSPTSIYTDLPAGSLLFGREWAPRVGDPVLVERNGRAAPMPAGYRPAIGDRLVLVARGPAPPLREIRWTNRVGGLVTASFADGTAAAVGRVERAVGAVGRFGGSQYAGRGEVRANHPGVLCVSTSPVGSVGGFQVVPSRHARAPNLRYVWGVIPAWMVVGPLLPHLPPLEGRGPLFAGQIRPRTGRCLVRYGLGPWQSVPERVGLVKDGLAGVTEVRLCFAAP